MHLPPLATFVSLLSICSALMYGGRPQPGSPIAPGFYPKGNSVSSGAFKIQDVLGRFDSFGKVTRRSVVGQSCGSSTLEVCPNDPTECCQSGGTCCGKGRCCPPGNVCRVNIHGEVVCCAQGDSCSSIIMKRAPPTPCTDRSAVPCANFNFCCPAGNLCSVVGGQNSCTPSSNVSSSTSSSTSSRSTSTSSTTSWTTSTTSTRSTTTTTSSTTSSSTTHSTSPTTTPTVSSPTPPSNTPPVTVLVTITPKTTAVPSTLTLTNAPPSTPAPTVSTPAPEPTSIVTSIISTVVEFKTIVSSVEISAGVFSSTDVVIESTRVVTLAPAEITSSQTETPSPNPSPSSSKVPTTAIIAGASIGGTLFLVAIGFLIFCCARRGRGRRRPPSLEFPPVREPTVPVLLRTPDDRYRDVPVSPVSELSPTTSPAPRYSAMYAPPPPGVVEIQGEESTLGGSKKYQQQPQAHEVDGTGNYGYPAELPSQQPFIDPRGQQGFGQNVGRGY